MDSVHAETPADDRIQYSVIVPSYNSEKTIADCLSSLVDQADLESTEIIVVDSSRDGTARLVKERFPRVALIHSKERKSAGEARNLGIQKARGRILLFIDSDCVADPDWIAKMTAAHGDDEYAAVGGGVENGNPETLASWAGYFLEFSRHFPAGRRRGIAHVPTCNVSYKKHAFDETEGFPADMYPVEDRVFNEDLVARGGRILFDPEIRVRHFHRTTFGDLLGHQLTIGRGSAWMRKRPGRRKSLLVKSPLLLPLVLPLLLIGRLAFVAKRFPTYKPRITLMWLISFPLYFVGLIFWLAGFAQGVFLSGPKEDRQASSL